jgi:hypothetical protein
VPVREFVYIDSVVRVLRLPIAVGIVPYKELIDNLRKAMPRYQFPILDGMVPVNKFELMSKYVKEWKLPIVEGRVPTSPKPLRSILRILA